MKVIQFQRRPFEGAFSLEGFFTSVRSEMLTRGITVEQKILPLYSQGVVPRIKNTLWARSFSADVFHVTGDVHFITMGLPKSKTILTICDLEMLSRLKGVKKFLLKKFWFDIPIACSRYVSVISEFTKVDLLRKVRCDGSKVHVIPVSIDRRYKPHPYRFNSDLPTILQVGTKLNKNIERLVVSLAGLKVRLHIVGSLTDAQIQLLKQCNTNYSCSSNLSQDELIDCYNQADVISFVSTHEGFGMPILEGQWVERPVITSNVSSMPEVAGPGAYLVDPLDTNSIRNGFVQVLGSSTTREDLIAKGRLNRERYTIEAIVDQYMDLYDAIVSDRNPRSYA